MSEAVRKFTPVQAAGAKGRRPSSPSSYASHQNVREIMKDRLPGHVLSLLEEAGRLGDQKGLAVFVVGGVVRDLLLGIGNLDLDLVVAGDGIAFARALARTHNARVKAYERFGTALLFFPDGIKLDVTTARAESYRVPAALPTVVPSGIKDDLFRRDFTINALAVRLNARFFGELVDLYGGRRDLDKKTIRVLHSRSFIEDPTRIFRAVRFERRFGFSLDRDTLALLRGAAEMDLPWRLSGHRLLNELVLLLSEERPRRAVARLGELDLLRFIHPGLTWSQRLATLLKGVEEALHWYKRLSLERKIDRWLVYFMALMDRLPDKGIEGTLQRLPVSARHAETIRTGYASSHDILRRLAKRPPPTPAETYCLLKGQSDETLLLLVAKTKSEAVKRRLSAYLTTYQQVKPILTGTDLTAMGLKPGPQYKKILDRLLEARLNGKIASEAEERELVKRIARL